RLAHRVGEVGEVAGHVDDQADPRDGDGRRLRGVLVGAGGDRQRCGKAGQSRYRARRHAVNEWISHPEWLCQAASVWPGSQNTKPWILMRSPLGGLDQPSRCRNFWSVSIWMRRMSPGPLRLGSVIPHVQSPSSLICVQSPTVTWLTWTNVGILWTLHGGRRARRSGIPGLKPPPRNVAPPSGPRCRPRTRRRVVTTA